LSYASAPVFLAITQLAAAGSKDKAIVDFTYEIANKEPMKELREMLNSELFQDL
jgi:hypothetical protein